MADSFDYQDLIRLFNETFADSDNTRLVKGDEEPIYLPADNDYSYHRIIFAHGYFASALHEIAHWCIAGRARRQQVDFGYWYIPDGRSAEQQRSFEHVEVKPQAVEWGLTAACGAPFRVSTDNLQGDAGDRLAFQHRVYDQVLIYLQQGFPRDAAIFIERLRAFYHQPPLTRATFDYRGMYERDPA